MLSVDRPLGKEASVMGIGRSAVQYMGHVQDLLCSVTLDPASACPQHQIVGKHDLDTGSYSGVIFTLQSQALQLVS